MTRVIITDLTRMRGTNVCIAGLMESRPIRLHDPAPTEGLLRQIGGLKPGDIVNVSWTASANPSRPHVEDGKWDSQSITKTGTIRYSDFRDKLADMAYETLSEAFGEIYLKGAGGNFAFRPGVGARSLASIVAKNVEVYLDFDEKIRVAFEDSRGPWRKVALEDLIVRTHTCGSCNRNLVRTLQREFDTKSAVLRVGLSRPYAPPSHPMACWVQVNGIYPMDREREHFI